MAIQIAKLHDGRYHLVLAVRRQDDHYALSTAAALEKLHCSFEFRILDLSSLGNVKSFADGLQQSIRQYKIPSFSGGGIILSAAMFTWQRHSVTKDNWSEMYGVNVMAQMLLVRQLLPVLTGALIIPIISPMHEGGDANYFSTEEKSLEMETKGETVSLSEGVKRYGSSKLVFLMSFYALRRRLSEVSSRPVKVFNTHPNINIDPKQHYPSS